MLVPRAGVAGVAHVEALDQAFDVGVRELLVGHVEAVLRLDVVPQLGRAVRHLLSAADLDQRILHATRGMGPSGDDEWVAKQDMMTKSCRTRSFLIVGTSFGMWPALRRWLVTPAGAPATTTRNRVKEL